MKNRFQYRVPRVIRLLYRWKRNVKFDTVGRIVPRVQSRRGAVFL